MPSTVLGMRDKEKSQKSDKVYTLKQNKIKLMKWADTEYELKWVGVSVMRGI